MTFILESCPAPADSGAPSLADILRANADHLALLIWLAQQPEAQPQKEALSEPTA
ncbi:MAG: hypothetical protein L6Q98_17660 [Anaerolineae bacterium]|nr:hypothetical protein [Anaerolineae bacterium]NUQ05966.1 hypothetical protein [Anaerolineae bacterium]